jgi:hypothetical protein
LALSLNGKADKNQQKFNSGMGEINFILENYATK